MRIALALALVACHAAPAPAPGPSPVAVRPAWSEQTFEANVQATLAERFPGQPITRVDDETFQVGTTQVRFAKARDACREDWAQCEAAVARTLDAINEIRNAGTIGRSQLRVILRSNRKVEYASARTKLTVQPFSRDAQWVLAADMPNTIRYDITAESLGMTVDEAWQVALANTKPSNLVTAVASGVVVVYQDVYAPTALRFPALMDETARKALPGKTGKLLAICPEENIVLYTIGGAEEVAGLRSASAEVVAKSQIPLSAVVMEWDGSSWREAD